MATPSAPRPTLYELRLHAGFASQRQIAARLGICTRSYQLYETGQHDPRPAMVRKLARVLRVKQALLWEVLAG